MGAHSKPSTIRRATALAATLAMPAVGAVAFAGTAHAAPPDAIAQCESGGNIRAENPSSSASGKWQILSGTWADHGGLEFAPTAGQATEAQQDIVATRIMNGPQGLGAWDASRHCWGGADLSPSPSAPAPAPAPSGPVVDSGRASDGTGEYTCTTSKLSFDACDPHNIGEVVAYPLYDGHSSAQRPSSAGTYTVQAGDTLSQVAEAHGTTVQRLVEINDIANPDLIFAGNSLHVG